MLAALKRLAAIAVTTSIVGACVAVPPGSASPALVSMSIAPTKAPARDPGLPSAAGPRSSPASPATDLAYPPSRRLPINPPGTATPEVTIDAFLHLVRDPALSLHMDGTGRWTVGDVETRTSTVGDVVGDDRWFVVTSTAEAGGEIVLRGDRAAARIGTGDWTPIDPSPVRALFDLRHTIVVGDLGPDGPGGPYRLVVRSGFDVAPRVATPFQSYSPLDSTIELAIDADGRPLDLRYHRSIVGSLNGVATRSEGVERFAFSRLGEALALPEPALRGTVDPLPSVPLWLAPPEASPTAADWRESTLLGGGFAVDMPGDPEAIGIEISFPHFASIEIPSLVVAEAAGARFSVGDVQVPPEVVAGRSVDERDADVRWATTSRIDNGNVLGYRAVTLAGSPGREVVVDSSGSIHRIRNVVIDDRLVTLSVSGAARAVGSAEADRFLGSLRRVP